MLISVNPAKMHGEPDPPAEDRAAVRSEDLAALLTRLLEEVERDQKELADEAGIPYPTLNAWVSRTRGTSRIPPDRLRDITNALRRLGADVTPRLVFEAAGRRIPGPTDKEREEKLLRIFRRMTREGQRALIQTAEAMERGSRAS